MNKFGILVAACGLAFSVQAHASVLAQFDFTSDTASTISDPRIASATFSPNVWAYVGDDGYGNVLEAYSNVEGGGAAEAVTADSYFSIDLSSAIGDTLGVKSFSFDAGKGGYNDPRGFFIRSSLDGFSANLISVDLPADQPPPAPYFVNLSMNFTNATDVTFRFYVFTPTFGNSVDFRNLSFDSEAVTVPEPATWAMMLLGFGLAGAGLRRRAGSRAAA